MKLLSTILAAISLLSATEACKCWNSQGRDVSEYTHACCTYTGGVFRRDENNCDGDIFDKLDTFAECCENLGVRTDCKLEDGEETEERKGFALGSGESDMSKEAERKRSVRFIG